MKLHPSVVRQTQTCIACPEQWEGEFADGRRFYFRYRWGTAALKTWVYDPDEPEKTNASIGYGDGYKGIFDNDFQRQTVFGALVEITEMGMKE